MFIFMMSAIIYFELRKPNNPHNIPATDLKNLKKEKSIFNWKDPFSFGEDQMMMEYELNRSKNLNRIGSKVDRPLKWGQTVRPTWTKMDGPLWTLMYETWRTEN